MHKFYKNWAKCYNDFTDDVQLSVSIGGMYNINNIDEALAYADKLMYQGKKKHKKSL